MNDKYKNLETFLLNALRIAKKIGISIQPGGGYVDSSYSINNLPSYHVGLFGALTIVFGPNARCKIMESFGLSFDDTMSLEFGFNGNRPDLKTKKRKKQKEFKLNNELFDVGCRLLDLLLYKPRHDTYGTYGAINENKKAALVEAIKKLAKKKIIPQPIEIDAELPIADAVYIPMPNAWDEPEPDIPDWNM